MYLDGDTERAQILGEELGAAGYPTVIIYTPSGQEVMRMPSDVSVERYVELLDGALSRMRPISEVLAQHHNLFGVSAGQATRLHGS